VPTVLVHGAADNLVPISQSETYVAAAGSSSSLARFEGDHFQHLDPTSEACDLMRAALATL